MRSARTLGAVLAALAVTGAAQEGVTQQGRIFKGTLGDAPITACFDPSGSSPGVYYRDAALEPVRLELRDAATPLVLTEASGIEDATGAQWVMASASGETMTGEWRKGTAVLPIRLTAVPADLPDYGSACEAPQFVEPLLAGGTTTRRDESLEGMVYTRIAYDGPARAGLEDYHIVTFALRAEQAGDAAINARLAAALPDGSANHDMGLCATPSLANAGMPGYIDETRLPMLITPRWLAVRHGGSSYCGGAHPNNFSNLVVYDRESGAEVDASAWFRPGALTFYDWEPEPGNPRLIEALSDALTEAVMARWPEGARDPECMEAARSGMGWDIGLTREGPVFEPEFPHVLFACTEEVTLPWEAARPFLSAKGRAVMKGLRQAPQASAR